MRVTLAIALVTLISTPLSADVLMVEKTVAKGGGKTFESVRSSYIKGTRMRAEVAQGGKTTVMVYDLPAGETIELEAAKRRAYVRGVAARNAKLEKEYPRSASTVSLTATGSTQSVAGTSCDDHTLAVRVPMTKDGSIALTLNGTACLAAMAAGVDDYMTFAKAAYEQNLVLGQASDNYILLGFARGQTELYRALTAKGGVPLIVDLVVAVDGKGMLAGIVRKAMAGSRLTTVSKIESTPVDDAVLVIPGGWKREAK